MNKTEHSIHFFYPQSGYLMGQEAASQMILRFLSGKYIFKPHHIPSINRENKIIIWSSLKYLFGILRLWANISTLLFRRNISIYLNLGQTWNSIFRDGLPFICLKLFRKNLPIVISLHGHWFSKWDRNSLKMRAFIKTLLIANFVVVLNETQKQLLISYGLKKENVKIIANTCDIKPLSDELLTHKHQNDSTTRILFLSNLIDSKGYKEFLAMLGMIRNFNSTSQIEAILCGNLMQSGFSEEPAESPEAIEAIIAELNINDNTNVRWIKGAYGSEKKDMFRKSHIFVFPSRIEAQPIVLLEAMASGCVIISSDVGLIPSMMQDNAAILLENLEPGEIAKSTAAIINDKKKRITVSLNALERYKTNFSNSIYTTKWNKLFTELIE